ncbi:MAG TPA: S1 RNA-binding domain-containing protein, partial [Chitinophagaceae bacterium]|nr:S1 RNA-binding domain-containing protein [Chitinophagaceae bacterium]
SQLSNTYVSDPNQVVKLQQKVMVTVTEVDVARKRIALSMKSAAGADRAEPRQERKSSPAGNGKNAKQKEAPLNPFQAKLAELKKKMG